MSKLEEALFAFSKASSFLPSGKLEKVKINATDGTVTTDFRSGVWMKDGNNFVNIENVLPDASLKDIHIYEFDN